MTYDQFKESLSYGEEYNFFYNNHEYWISKNSKNHFLTDVEKQITQEFDSSDSLLSEGTVEGKHIKDIWDEIENQL